jgi:Putative DNA-binding domain
MVGLLGLKRRANPLPAQTRRRRTSASVVNLLQRQEQGLSFVKREQWTEDQVKGLPPGEHDYFERKSGVLFDDRTERNNLYDTLAKAASAFANSGGGHLVLGVTDEGTFDGVPTLIAGRTTTRDWLEQKLPDLLDYRLADFRVHTVLRSKPSSIPEGREVIIIDIGDSPRLLNFSRRQLLANAAIAASRVSSEPRVGVRSS